MADIEFVKTINNDIQQKLSEVKNGSDAHKFLLAKKKILDDCIKKIVYEASFSKYEWELYMLAEKRLTLQNKIHMKEDRPSDDDDDVRSLKEVIDRINWIRESKLKGVRQHTYQNSCKNFVN